LLSVVNKILTKNLSASYWRNWDMPSL